MDRMPELSFIGRVTQQPLLSAASRASDLVPPLSATSRLPSERPCAGNRKIKGHNIQNWQKNLQAGTAEPPSNISWNQQNFVRYQSYYVGQNGSSPTSCCWSESTNFQKETIPQCSAEEKATAVGKRTCIVDTWAMEESRRSNETWISIFGSYGFFTFALPEHPVTVMIWSCMSWSGAARIQVVNEMLNATWYIHKVLEPKLLPLIHDMFGDGAEFYLSAWWSPMSYCSSICEMVQG